MYVLNAMLHVRVYPSRVMITLFRSHYIKCFSARFSYCIFLVVGKICTLFCINQTVFIYTMGKYFNCEISVTVKCQVCLRTVFRMT